METPKAPAADETLDYVFPERRFTGSRREVITQLDELIVGPVAVRQMLEPRAAQHAELQPQRNLRLVPPLLALLFVHVVAPPGTASTQDSVLTNQSSQEQPAAPAATSDPFEHVRFGVALEAYYAFNGNRPHDRINLLRAYDTHANVFSIQQAAIVVESVTAPDQGRRFGARVDLQFGQATETVQGSAANEPRPEVYRHVWQAFGTYVFPVGRGLRADFGKFASNLGYETNYAKDNDHFSRAYLFNFLPFYHSGLRLGLPVSDTVTVMYMLTNGIQQTEDLNNFKSHHVSATVTAPAHVTWTTNYYIGQEQPDGGVPEGPDGFFRVFDTYVTYAPIPALRVGLDANYVTNEVQRENEGLALQGTGVYARYQLSPPVAIAVRYERLDDEGLFGGADQILNEITATAEYRFAEGVLARAELRRDWSNRPFFTTRTPGTLREAQNTILGGLVWWFGNKPGTW